MKWSDADITANVKKEIANGKSSEPFGKYTVLVFMYTISASNIQFSRYNFRLFRRFCRCIVLLIRFLFCCCDVCVCVCYVRGIFHQIPTCSIFWRRRRRWHRSAWAKTCRENKGRRKMEECIGKFHITYIDIIHSVYFSRFNPPSFAHSLHTYIPFQSIYSLWFDGFASHPSVLSVSRIRFVNISTSCNNNNNKTTPTKQIERGKRERGWKGAWKRRKRRVGAKKRTFLFLLRFFE